MTHRDEEKSAFSEKASKDGTPSKRSKKNKPRRDFVCFGCGKPGHIKASCRKKIGEKSEQNEKKALIAVFKE